MFVDQLMLMLNPRRRKLSQIDSVNLSCNQKISWISWIKKLSLLTYWYQMEGLKDQSWGACFNCGYRRLTTVTVVGVSGERVPFY